MDEIKKGLAPALAVIALGFLIMSGMRLAEYAFERPPAKLLICISDSEGQVGDCSDFADYVDDKK